MVEHRDRADHNGCIAPLRDDRSPGAEGVDKKFVDTNNVHIVHFSCKGEDKIIREIGTPITTQKSEGGVHTIEVLVNCTLKLAHNDGGVCLGVKNRYSVGVSCDRVLRSDNGVRMGAQRFSGGRSWGSKDHSFFGEVGLVEADVGRLAGCVMLDGDLETYFDSTDEMVPGERVKLGIRKVGNLGCDRNGCSLGCITCGLSKRGFIVLTLVAVGLIRAFGNLPQPWGGPAMGRDGWGLGLWGVDDGDGWYGGRMVGEELDGP